MIPKMPMTDATRGINSACQYTPRDFLRYRVKSGILVPMVAHPPVILDMDDKINQDLVDPETLAG